MMNDKYINIFANKYGNAMLITLIWQSLGSFAMNRNRVIDEMVNDQKKQDINIENVSIL